MYGSTEKMIPVDPVKKMCASKKGSRGMEWLCQNGTQLLSACDVM